MSKENLEKLPMDESMINAILPLFGGKKGLKSKSRLLVPHVERMIDKSLEQKIQEHYEVIKEGGFTSIGWCFVRMGKGAVGFILMAFQFTKENPIPKVSKSLEVIPTQQMLEILLDVIPDKNQA